MIIIEDFRIGIVFNDNRVLEEEVVYGMEEVMELWD